MATSNQTHHKLPPFDGVLTIADCDSVWLILLQSTSTPPTTVFTLLEKMFPSPAVTLTKVEIPSQPIAAPLSAVLLEKVEVSAEKVEFWETKTPPPFAEAVFKV